MIGIGEINIKGKGKSVEEIKKEAMAAFEKQLDEMIGAKAKEDKKEEKKEPERKPSKISMVIEEDEKMTGFGIESDVELNGLDYEETMTMLTTGIAQLFRQLFEDKAEGLLAIAQFAPALLFEYQNEEDDEDGE